MTKIRQDPKTKLSKEELDDLEGIMNGKIKTTSYQGEEYLKLLKRRISRNSKQKRITTHPAGNLVEITDNGFTVFTSGMPIDQWFSFDYDGSHYAVRVRKDGSMDLAETATNEFIVK